MVLHTYESSKDPLAGVAGTGIGRLGQIPARSDSVDLPKYVVVHVVGAGNIVFLPPNNDDADPVLITGAPVGYTVPWEVRRIYATGTTAVLRTIEKAY